VNLPFSFILSEKRIVYNLFTHAFVVTGTESGGNSAACVNSSANASASSSVNASASSSASSSANSSVNWRCQLALNWQK
ncbi:MAG: hypothetical protein K2K90_02500, partial [Lachnospiraceae bacterium]|nr:hypothetical protein [Lachnospiraceae bacterium]